MSSRLPEETTKIKRPCLSIRVARCVAELRSMANPANVKGMARYGISTAGTLGVTVAAVRVMARKIGHDRDLARRLWASGIHEARILSCLLDEPGTITRRELNARVRDIDSWDVCDLFCNNLVVDVPFAWKLAGDWAKRRAEFVRRAGFSTLASLAVHDHAAADDVFIAVLPLIVAAADDDRTYIRKAVNWALRSIGKRNQRLRQAALTTAYTLRKRPSRSARWIATDAIRELTDPDIVARIKTRK